MSEKILLVEDDCALAMGTEYALSAEGYEVVCVGNIRDARSALDDCVSLILLDVMLPDGNGYDFCRELRSQGRDLPVIFLTALAEEVNIIRGLELGGDDYVTKPFRVKELVSRIAANLRRYGKGTYRTREEYRFGRHCFYPEKFKLFKDGRPTDFTISELKILRELIECEGTVISRDRLLSELFDSEEIFVDDNTLSVYMKRLRDKLGEDAKFIRTVRGRGYLFTREGENL
ncbi:MAG: response regulator transcription factor [Lachnospiraceae bacterium]